MNQSLPSNHDREFDVSAWHMCALLVSGSIVTAIPFFVRGPRGFDKFLFCVGVSFVASVILMILFPEMRNAPNPRFEFQSKVRMIAAAVMTVSAFLSVIVLAEFCRVHGFWR